MPKYLEGKLDGVVTKVNIYNAVNEYIKNDISTNQTSKFKTFENHTLNIEANGSTSKNYSFFVYDNLIFLDDKYHMFDDTFNYKKKYEITNSTSSNIIFEDIDINSFLTKYDENNETNEGFSLRNHQIKIDLVLLFIISYQFFVKKDSTDKKEKRALSQLRF